MQHLNCSHCGEEFDRLYSETQAYRCAADIMILKNELYMMGHYGSTVADGILFKVLTNEYKEGIICDDCIQKGLDAGHFECVSENNYFGLKG